MSAEYGRAAGATINVAYASGTNQFRGSAWEFARRTALNATGFFRPPDGVKPPFERDQYGGVIGGPHRAQQGVLLRRLRGLQADARHDGEHDDRQHGAAQPASSPSTCAIRSPAPCIRPARRFR